MLETWSIIMLVSGALFAGGMVPIVLERAPVWRMAEAGSFRVQFADTLRRVDRVQPGLLFVCLIATIGFAITAAGTASTLAWIAGALLVAVLIGSLVGLVPVQQRLADTGKDLSNSEVGQLRARWLGGHLIRTVVAVACFVLLAAAAVV